MKTLHLALALAAASATATAQTEFGTACIDSAGNLPQISYSAGSWISNPSIDEHVTLNNAVPGLNAVLFIGAPPLSEVNFDLSVIQADGCSLYVDPFLQAPAVVGLDGTADVGFGSVPFGNEWVFQWVILDPNAPRTLPLDTTARLRAGVPAATSAFRIDSLELKDPHAFQSALFLCLDITGTLNTEINNSINGDSEPDGLLDLNLMLLMRPYDPSGAGGVLDFVVPTCSTAPTCAIPAGPPLGRTTFTNSAGGTCVSPVAGTTSGYSPGVVSPSGPCFSTASTSLSFDFLGINVPLENVQIGGQYDAANNEIDNGLLMGFLPESAASQIQLPPIPLLPPGTLASVLAGGPGNCASNDDRDVGPSGALGWWFYFNFHASSVPITP